jgi:hypothetical protein
MTEYEAARFTPRRSPASLGHMRRYVIGRAFA